MLDVHTHYDAEVLASPGLGEPVRHGVTTVILGNCSLSTVYCDADDCADMFARVEAVPRSMVRSTVKEFKTWHDPAGYVAAIEALPLGANIAAFIGHSDMRAATMGLGRSVDSNVRPTRTELRRMSRMLVDALDAGFVGLSTIRSSWSKLEGTRYPARQLPSGVCELARVPRTECDSLANGTGCIRAHPTSLAVPRWRCTWRKALADRGVNR